VNAEIHMVRLFILGYTIASSAINSSRLL